MFDILLTNKKPGSTGNRTTIERLDLNQMFAPLEQITVEPYHQLNGVNNSLNRPTIKTTVPIILKTNKLVLFVY